MTNLRLPAPDRLPDATQLATTDDTREATGFSTVAVRPWNVVVLA